MIVAMCSKHVNRHQIPVNQSTQIVREVTKRAWHQLLSPSQKKISSTDDGGNKAINALGKFARAAPMNLSFIWRQVSLSFRVLSSDDLSMVIGWIESVADLQDADVYDDCLQCVHRGRTESYVLITPGFNGSWSYRVSSAPGGGDRVMAYKLFIS